jgi:penicillin amidase
LNDEVAFFPQGNWSMMRHLNVCVGLITFAWMAIDSLSGNLWAETNHVEILRDKWGIAHVFSDTDAGAFYGLGYATAEDRAFQMMYSLRIVQGRLSEVVGKVAHTRRKETSIDHDRKMRTFGFYRAAQRTAANLDADTGEMLQAYCDGVNAYLREYANRLHPMFSITGLEPEPWTPADCLASWWQLGQYFATDGTRDLIAGRNLQRRNVPRRSAQGRMTAGTSGRGAITREPRTDLRRMPPDDDPAVVKRSDVPAEWVERVRRYAEQHGLASDSADGPEGPKFSHAWVVGGTRTTSGSAVLVSDPQTPVRNPSLLYQFHVQGETFNARGVGVAGSPILLIGFTNHVAWGVTALGADQADLFLLETDPDHPDQYRFDGRWRPMTVHREVIRVKGEPPIEYPVRETHLGPVATEFCFAQPSDGEVVLKRIPTCETDRETIQGALAMMRARCVQEFDDALAGWRFPSANVVFGDWRGDIGYRVLAAIPLRSNLDSTHGRTAQPAASSDRDWREMIPHDLLPGVTNPPDGFLYSGNHRPVESWYPLPLGTMTGAGGDTVRSWRLRERLESKSEFTPEEVLDIHNDAVNPARRDIVRVALHLRDQLQRDLSNDALNALAVLEPWWKSGASMSLDQAGAEVALELNTFFRFVSTDLAQVYGGGESGLAYFLKSAVARLEKDASADMSEMEREFIEQSLAGAWQSARRKYGQDPSRWNSQAREAITRRQLGYFEALHGFPALDSEQFVSMPALAVIDGGTIACQVSQSYTQWVPMHDPDSARCILPIGQSEWPDDPARTSTLELWATGQLHPAPLSRQHVETLVTDAARVLTYDTHASASLDRKDHTGR